jgi:broad specificity phosphatase PhoE
MVRVLLVRHAQSRQNAHMLEVEERLERGELSAAGFNKAMRDAPDGLHAGADACLTELGEQQARDLGEAWAPLLEAKARQGRLHVLVSPFLRTLQTASPLLERCACPKPRALGREWCHSVAGRDPGRRRCGLNAGWATRPHSSRPRWRAEA